MVAIRGLSINSMKNISEARRPILIKFTVKHHWVWGLTALGFGVALPKA